MTFMISSLASLVFACENCSMRPLVSAICSSRRFCLAASSDLISDCKEGLIAGCCGVANSGWGGGIVFTASIASVMNDTAISSNEKPVEVGGVLLVDGDVVVAELGGAGVADSGA